MTDIANDAAAPQNAVEAQHEATPHRRHAWTDTEPRPWRRLVARLLDISLFGTIGVIIASFVAVFVVGPEQVEAALALLEGGFSQLLSGIVLVILALPLIALSIAWTGGTPGKWLLGVRVQRPDGRRLGVVQAFKRECMVAGLGMALGLPLISLFTMHAAREHLEENDFADWDDPDQSEVVHRSDGVLQTTYMVIGVAVLVILRLWGLMEQLAAMPG